MGIIIVLVQVGIFFLYTTYIRVYYKKQPSVSHSYYSLPSNRNFLFTIVMWMVAIGQLVHIEISQWFFLSAAGFGFTGAANAFEDEKMTKYVHYIGTIVGIIGAMLGLHMDWMLLLICVLIIAWLYLYEEEYFIWNVEHYMLIIIGVEIIQRYLNR